VESIAEDRQGSGVLQHDHRDDEQGRSSRQRQVRSDAVESQDVKEDEDRGTHDHGRAPDVRAHGTLAMTKTIS
jgi:hypothetical protein